MAEQFLENILRAENKASSGTDTQCQICLQPLGELSRETGVIECGIRLPCNHAFGSACIATWLKSSNTCPMCRLVLYTPAPTHDSGLVADSDEDDDDATGGDEQARRIALCDILAPRLGFGSRARTVIEDMAELLWGTFWIDGHTRRCTVATAIYMTSHLINRPRSVEAVARVSELSANHLRDTYQGLRRRMDFVPVSFLGHLGTTRMQRFLAVLPASDVSAGLEEDLGIPESDGGCGRCPLTRDEAEQLCENFCAELNFEGFAEDVAWLIAHKLSVLFRRGHGHFSKSQIALGIFIASHLVGMPRSMAKVSMVTGVFKKTMSQDYTSQYNERQHFVDQDMIDIIVEHKPRRDFEILPPLAWPES